jgi:heat shock protein HtpX
MAVTFHDLIAANKRNSAILVACFILFTAAVAMVLALAILYQFSPDAAIEANLTRSLLVGGAAAGVSLLIALLSYYRGDRMVLGISGARPFEKKDDPQLYNVVEEIAIAVGVPMPQVYLIEDSAPNAFATGRDPKHASVAITRGLRSKLNREELQGVIAHEMAHIRNYDIRLMLLMAVLIGTIVMLTDFFWQMLRFMPARRHSSSSKDGKGGNPLMIVVFVAAIILAIIAPILAQIIQLAVSRQREYLADATAVQLTRNPVGLARALKIIDDDPEILESANRGTAHLYIANPIKHFEARAHSLFASHPPIKTRITRLLELAHEKA